jgi:hypothetical protein
MTGLVRNATLLGVCGLIFAGVASASVPDPTKSTIGVTGSGACIRVGGKQSNPTLVDQFIGYPITVRDFGNNPIAGANVEINFQNCTDVKLCTAVVSGQTVDCINRSVRVTTNAAGQVTVSVLGAGIYQNPLASPNVQAGTGSGCVRVFAEGIQLGTATALIQDWDGASGSNSFVGETVLDLGKYFGEEAVISSGGGVAQYRGRDDFSLIGNAGAGAINVQDLSFYFTTIGQASGGTGSSNGCRDNAGVIAPYCP